MEVKYVLLHPTHLLSRLTRQQQKPGVDKGPIHLVEAGLIEQLKELSWNVKFDGHHQFEDINSFDDQPIGILKNPRLVSRVTESVAKVVGGHARMGRLPVTLGGDHSLVGVNSRNNGILWTNFLFRRRVPFLAP